MVPVSGPKKKGEGRANQYAYPGLDRVIHERARLSVLEQVVRDAATAVKEGRSRVSNVKS